MLCVLCYLCYILCVLCYVCNMYVTLCMFFFVCYMLCYVCDVMLCIFVLMHTLQFISRTRHKLAYPAACGKLIMRL
jgi:hypothetical protein